MKAPFYVIALSFVFACTSAQAQTLNRIAIQDVKLGLPFSVNGKIYALDETDIWVLDDSWSVSGPSDLQLPFFSAGGLVLDKQDANVQLAMFNGSGFSRIEQTAPVGDRTFDKVAANFEAQNVYASGGLLNGDEPSECTRSREGSVSVMSDLWLFSDTETTRVIDDCDEYDGGAPNDFAFVDKQGRFTIVGVNSGQSRRFQDGRWETLSSQRFEGELEFGLGTVEGEILVGMRRSDQVFLYHGLPEEHSLVDVSPIDGRVVGATEIDEQRFVLLIEGERLETWRLDLRGSDGNGINCCSTTRPSKFPLPIWAAIIVLFSVRRRYSSSNRANVSETASRSRE